MTNCLGDLVSFYTCNHIDTPGALLSEIYLQKPLRDSKYPTLDPDLNTNLGLYVFTLCRFGFKDAGSLSVNAKNMMHSLYIKHHPDNRHKMAKELAIQVGNILKKSYMDDVNCATSATEIAKK